MRKFKFGFYLVVITALMLGCKKKQMETGQIEFSFSEIKENENVGLKSGTSAFAIILTAEDIEGNLVYEKEQIELINFEGEYLSKPVKFDLGEYILTEFLVIDADNNVLYASPLEGSKWAYLVNQPLPIEFSVSKDNVTKVSPEVVDVTQRNPADFGYATFTFQLNQAFKINIQAMEYSKDDDENYIAVDSAYLEVKAGSSALFAGHINQDTEEIYIAKGYNVYHFEVSKLGYTTFSDTLTSEELMQNETLIVFMQKVQISNDGLIGYYTFENNTNDLSSYNNHGVPKNGLTYSNGLHGSAALLDGVDDYIEVPDNPSLDVNSISISVWLKPTKFGYYHNGISSYAEYSGPVSKNSRDPYNQSGFSTTATELSLRFSAIFTEKPSADPQVRHVVDLYNWQHIVYVLDNGTVKIYKNGELLLEDNEQAGKELTSNDEPLLIGLTYWFPNYTLLSSYFTGSIDNLRIYDRPLSNTEIQSLYYE